MATKISEFTRCFTIYPFLSLNNFHKNMNLVKPLYHIPFRNSFYEPDSRGRSYDFMSKKTLREHIRDGRKLFVNECKLFMEEMKEKFLNDPKLYQHGDTDVFFRFDSEECLDKWRVSSDKVNEEGFSEANLIINNKRKGVFYGTIDTTPPKDGKLRYAGWSSIKSKKLKKSFLRATSYDWYAFTHLELRVKGDGRNYAIMLGANAYYDVQWFKRYTYPMFTHGGPYWQTIRIPFSKFFITSKGRIQDKQFPAPKDRIDSIGILCAGVPGPFRLEIDYIGCHLDTNYKEQFAYELYKIPKEIVSY